MHVAKRRTVSAALGAALVALCTTGLNSALATEKAAAVRASAQAQSSGSTLAVANNILNRWEAIAQAAGAHSAVWRELFGTQLNQMSEQALRRLEMVSAEGSPKAAYARFTEAFAGAQMQRFASEESAKTVLKDLGSTTIDQVFIPITPCRVVDTRASSGGTGPISAGNERDFYFYNVNPSWSWQTGASGSGAQGGQPGVAATVCPGDDHDSRGRDTGRGRTFGSGRDGDGSGSHRGRQSARLGRSGQPSHVERAQLLGRADARQHDRHSRRRTQWRGFGLHGSI